MRRDQRVSTGQAVAALAAVFLLAAAALLGFWLFFGTGLGVMLIVAWTLNAFMKIKPPRR